MKAYNSYALSIAVFLFQEIGGYEMKELRFERRIVIYNWRVCKYV